jgi:hypothetical protein
VPNLPEDMPFLNQRAEQLSVDNFIDLARLLYPLAQAAQTKPQSA